MLLGALLAQLGGHLARAQTVSEGFVVSGATSASGSETVGSRVTVRFQASNGDSVTDAPFEASTMLPAGATLVPHTQSCGVSGGTCSESQSGSELQWEVPVGAPAGSVFVFSYTVMVPIPNPATDFGFRLEFTGPGCQIQPSCVYQAPPIALLDQSGGSSGGLGGSTATTSTTTAPTPPTTDNQDLQVVVPECKIVGSKPNDKTRVKCEGTTGPGTPAPGNGRQSPASGLAFTTGPSGLAFTGLNLIRDIETGVVLVATGVLLVTAAGFRRRRGASI